ncbi:MAG: FtsX-like permease family protein [Bacteroidales bacterium]|jgi:ABC-type lipoprotein release transport system permease subunit|nr:FtsX-like permease family protein [Bacteroidales bacterium]
MLTKLAWKNIWRNRTRSGVVLGAVAIGLFAGTYLSAFMNGWMLGSVQADIDTNLSHIQISDTAFSANNDIGAYFLQTNVAEKLANTPSLKEISFRLILNGMLSSANNSVGMTANGVVPEDEQRVSTIWKMIPDSLGAFLPEDTRAAIVISEKTAEKLKVRLRSKIVFSFQTAAGEMQTMAFRVCGIFKTSNSAFDEGQAFVRYDDIFPLTALPENSAHKAYIRVADLETCEKITPELKTLFPDLSVQNWKELNPMFAMSLEYMDLYAMIIIGIFLFALAFGIINTMLMAILERTREIGMLAAIGMNRSRIFRMIMFETVFLTLLGSVAGIALAIAALIPSLHSGIDLTFMMSDSFEDYGFSSIVYPVISAEMFVEIVILVILTGILAAIYPARKALKLNPIEAIRS